MRARGVRPLPPPAEVYLPKGERPAGRGAGICRRQPPRAGRWRWRRCWRPCGPTATFPRQTAWCTAAAASTSMCICAKCGGTSLFSWLYEASTARHSARVIAPPWVQHVPSWEPPPNGAISFSDVPSTSTGPIDHFTIVRDPLDRYYSAWKSKIRCDRSDAADGNRLVPDLLRRAGLPASMMSEVRASNRTAPVPVTYCLGFKEFALAMRRIHARGQQARLDMHLLPQSLGRCKRDARRMTIAQFASVAPELSDRFGLQHVVFPHTHAEMTEEEAAHAAETRKEVEAELCAIVYPEYDWMGDDTTFARRCPQGTYRALEAETRLEGRLLLEPTGLRRCQPSKCCAARPRSSWSW